ncbi:IDEAL domain-containing protein [Paenibacillus durus]|uniref:IDEAL domain-containing protein n=1 Tax=Paenibacillus durus ATCC 35681 TaxID=1333534 RepID=A0A0F7F710_PAEDU|nr:IDEAL domain-containing protein [Paenibacillus durus]AKG33799.1 hypothetical protein VK70_03700 [Paenibacillus durus ATCC 35681]
MIRLETNEIVSIAKKQIASIFKMEPLELKFVNDFQGEKSLLNDDKLHLTNRHYWAKVMDCVFKDQVRPILMCEVLYFLRNEYLESDIDLEFSFDFSEGSIVEACAVAEVNFNDKTDLGKNEIAELIDFALALQDRQWFEELTEKYKELSA